jgi:TolB-like protein
LNPTDAEIHHFADLTLDLARGRLLRGASDVALRPKSFAMLAHLVRNADRVLSKETLLAQIWPDVTVTEDSLTQCIHEVRQALGPGAAHLLRTVPRRGYILDLAADRAADRAPAAAPAALRRDGVAVMPFALVVSDNPADATLLDGLVQDVTGSLSRLRGFHVISVGSTFALRAQATDPRAAGRALGVMYVVTGAAECARDRIRLRVEIAEAAGGSIIWTGQYAEPRADVPDLIGGVAQQIAQSVHSQITAAETRRARLLHPESMDAWELFHSALPLLYGVGAAPIHMAIDRFRAAAQLAPGFARAWSGQSAGHYVLTLTGLTADPVAEVTAARQTAIAAMERDAEDPFSQFSMGRSSWLMGDPAGALQFNGRAVDMAPSFAEGFMDIAMVESLQDDAARGIAAAEMFQSLSPFDLGLGAMLLVRAVAHNRLGQADKAVLAVRDTLRQGRDHAMVLAPAALVLADCGHGDEARQVTARLRGLPHFLGPEATFQGLTRMSDHLGRLYRRHAAQIGL